MIHSLPIASDTVVSVCLRKGFAALLGEVPGAVPVVSAPAVTLSVVGFSVRLAPGVRVRASSRGLRTSIGPRYARVHVGAGRTGISTGVGPFGYYTSLGGSRTGGSRAGARSTGTSVRALEQARKAQEGQRLSAALDAITNLHRETFEPAIRLVAPLPPPPDLEELIRQHEEQALKGLSVFARKARAAAREAAGQAARREYAERAVAGQAEQAHEQERLDAIWAKLCANDPETVLAVLAGAFEDNEAAAAPLGVWDRQAAIAVLVPPVSAIPEQRPALTQAGNPTLKKLTKTETATMYNAMVAGFAIVTAKEALAVAPGLASVRIIAIRRGEPDAFGQSRTELLVGTEFKRDVLARVDWQRADSWQVLEDASAEAKYSLKGRPPTLQPLDLATEPELAAVLAAVDTDEIEA